MFLLNISILIIFFFRFRSYPNKLNKPHKLISRFTVTLGFKDARKLSECGGFADLLEKVRYQSIKLMIEFPFFNPLK